MPIIAGATSEMSNSSAWMTGGCTRGFFGSLTRASLARGNPASVRSKVADGGVAPDIFCAAASITRHALLSGIT